MKRKPPATLGFKILDPVLRKLVILRKDVYRAIMLLLDKILIKG
ncbi:hypothetical protein [Halobacillus yeomjeoni]|nr:hypothetical protein [Halobacillus yeomjeoni]